MNERPNESRRTLINNFCEQLSCNNAEIAKLFETLDERDSFDAPVGELSIAFLSKEEICRLHHNHLHDPTPTDVITFPGEKETGLAGEICICPEVAWEYAQANGIDFSKELSLYLIHGYLHLCGFDDCGEEDRAEMRRAETRAMDIAESSCVLPSFEFTAQ